MSKIQAAIFIRVPYELDGDEVIFHDGVLEPGDTTVTFADMQPIGYVDYGGVQGDKVDLRLILRKSALVPEKKDTPQVLQEGTCTFEEYNGPCKKPGHPFCEKHLTHTCFECGKQATKYCTYEGMLVCGMDECDEHSHMKRHDEANTRFLSGK